MKILVTGGAGMIGSNLVEALRNLGHDVFVADNLWRGTVDNIAHIFPGDELGERFFEVDLAISANAELVTRDMDVVFHLADIVAGINFIFANEFEVWTRNQLINSNTLNAAIHNGVEHYVYVGTACSFPKHLTMGKNAGTILVESDAYPAEPESAYGWSKLMGEYEIELATKEGLIDSSILRLHNVYGFPSEISPERSQVIPALCRKAAAFPHEDFVVWGSGQQKRAFIYVADVVTALVKTLDSPRNRGPIQIGPSESTSIAELARKIIAISGKDIVARFDESKPEGDTDRIGDTSKAREILGWEPSVDLDSGLRSTYQWVASRISG